MEKVRDKVVRLLFDTPWPELREQAESVLLAHKGRHVFVRGLVEFSNQCRRNCHYCGLRGENQNLRRYTLTRDEIMDAAGQAAAAGADTIVLQSGESTSLPESEARSGLSHAEWIAGIVRDLRNAHDLPVTLSLGEHSKKDYALWKAAGASRYLLKHETADPKLYARLHPGFQVGDRSRHLCTLASLGYEIGSGFMVGLPGQSRESLVNDILLCYCLDVAMCGVGPFIAQADTPLAGQLSGDASLTLRVLATLRIMMPRANLPATTALATVDAQSGQRDGLLAGANVLMPCFTPAQYRSQYVIYDNKNRVDVTAARLAISQAGRSNERIGASPSVPSVP